MSFHRAVQMQRDAEMRQAVNILRSVLRQPARTVERSGCTEQGAQARMVEPYNTARRGRSNQPKGADAQALFDRVAALAPGATVPAPEIYKGLGMTRQFLGHHKNTGSPASWNEVRLDVVGKGARLADLISRESLLRWLGRFYMSVDDETLESLGALPAVKPVSKAKAG